MAPMDVGGAPILELPMGVTVVSVFGLVFTASAFAWICCQRKNNTQKPQKTPPYKFVHMLKGVDIYPESLGGKKKFAADAAATVAKRYGAVRYAKRLSVIWTRRSQSLHGMLVHCASTTSTASSNTSDEGGGVGDQFGGVHNQLQRGYIHTYNTTNSNSNAARADQSAASRGGAKRERGRGGGEELEESVV